MAALVQRSDDPHTFGNEQGVVCPRCNKPFIFTHSAPSGTNSTSGEGLLSRRYARATTSVPRNSRYNSSRRSGSSDDIKKNSSIRRSRSYAGA